MLLLFSFPFYIFILLFAYRGDWQALLFFFLLLLSFLYLLLKTIEIEVNRSVNRAAKKELLCVFVSWYSSSCSEKSHIQSLGKEEDSLMG